MTVNEKQKKVRAINEEWMGNPEDGGGTIAGDYEKEGWSFYMYEPFAFKNDDGSESVPYWEEKRKIVFCNLNAFVDFTHCTDEFHTFSWDIFQMSIHATGTLANTALFCYCLRKRLAGEVLPEAAALPGIFKNERAQVDDAMKRICYMNLDPLIHTDSSWTTPDTTGKSPCDWAWDFYQDSPRSTHFNRDSQRKLIAALEPDIFITTGIGKDAKGDFSGGFDLLNRIYQQKDAPDADAKYRYTGEELWLGRPCKDNGYVTFKRLETAPGKKTLFVSMPHPSSSVFNYQYIIDTVETICRKLSESIVSG